MKLKPRSQRNAFLLLPRWAIKAEVGALRTQQTLATPFPLKCYLESYSNLELGKLWWDFSKESDQPVCYWLELHLLSGLDLYNTMSEAHIAD